MRSEQEILKSSSYWQGLDELESLLPERKVIASSNGVNRYGFSHILAQRCGMGGPRRIFANWVHGWIWDECPTADSLHVGKQPRDIPVVVRNDVEKSALQLEGFRDVVIGGLPFAYTTRQHNSRNCNALLAIPPHSAETERLRTQQFDYLNFLQSMKDDYDGIYVSIFFLDWDGPMHHAALARGLIPVQGARPDDANSLNRVRALFEAFDQVTSNSIGSHFVYALHAGARFSFSGPMFTYDAEMLKGNGNPLGHSDARINRLLEIQDSSYLRRRFGRFFVDQPRLGQSDPEFGAREVGVHNQLSAEAIKNVLGWTVGGQLNGYVRGARRRIRRLAGRS